MVAFFVALRSSQYLSKTLDKIDYLCYATPCTWEQCPDRQPLELGQEEP